MSQSDPQAPSSGEVGHAWDPLRYFAWLYSLGPQRRILKALFGIEEEIGGSLRLRLDHQVAHSRLQWWHQECERYALGSSVHPLTRELQVALADPAGVGPRDGPSPRGDLSPRGGPSPRGDLAGFVDTSIWDLARATFETRRELTAYCDRWAAAMIQPLVPDADWRALGTALRELQMLTELAQEAHSGRLRVPLDELTGVDVDPAALAMSPWPRPLADLLRNRHESLRTTLVNSVETVTPGQRVESRGVLVWAALAYKISMRCQKSLPQPLQVRRTAGIADAWSAWRVARRVRNG